MCPGCVLLAGAAATGATVRHSNPLRDDAGMSLVGDAKASAPLHATLHAPRATRIRMTLTEPDAPSAGPTGSGSVRHSNSLREDPDEGTIRAPDITMGSQSGILYVREPASLPPATGMMGRLLERIIGPPPRRSALTNIQHMRPDIFAAIRQQYRINDADFRASLAYVVLLD